MPKAKVRRRPRRTNPQIDVRINIISIIIILVFAGGGIAVTVTQRNPAGVLLGLVIGFILAQSPKVARLDRRGVS